MVVVDRLLLAHCTARRLRGAAMAFAARNCACRRHCGGTPELEGRRLLDGARGGARGPSRRGHRAYFNGCGGGAAPLGSSTGALSLDLRHRVCAPADHSALAPPPPPPLPLLLLPSPPSLSPPLDTTRLPRAVSPE